MANGDGFSEVGGGGSVLFRVKVKNGGAPTVVPPGGGPQQRETNGKDEYEAPGETRDNHFFEIAIKLPTPAYQLRGRLAGNRLIIYLPISQTADPDQTRVSWAVRGLPGGLSDVVLR